MNTVTKVALGLAAAAVVVVGPLTLIASAHDLNGQNPMGRDVIGQGRSAPAWPDGNTPGVGRHRGPGPGMMNGAGPGAEAMADYLATELDVAPADVAAALQAWHAANPTAMRGWERSRADAESHHEAMADFLAGRLGVSADRIEAALDARMVDGCPWR